MIYNKNMKEIETAYFGGGCFWCTEAIFKMLKAVDEVEPGYAGGTTVNPTYDETGDHAETIKIEYDPTKISYENLLTVFFATHDPTTPNQQGADVGPQYRSMVLYTSDSQREKAEKFIQELNDSSSNGELVVTEVKKFDRFYLAEDYHRNYFATHQNTPYCQLVINPKLQKAKEKFNTLLEQ